MHSASNVKKCRWNIHSKNNTNEMDEIKSLFDLRQNWQIQFNGRKLIIKKNRMNYILDL
jgi:hypothetical protein